VGDNLKKTITHIIFVTIILLYFQSGFFIATKAYNTYKYIATPTTIVFYNNGKEIEIKKNSILFDNILELTDKRFSVEIYFYPIAIDRKYLHEVEKDGQFIEFIYSEMVETQYSDDPDFRLKYKRLLMPLSGEFNHCIFFCNENAVIEGMIPVLSSPNELIKILGF
jgi:hypothetical protein